MALPFNLELTLTITINKFFSLSVFEAYDTESCSTDRGEEI